MTSQKIIFSLLSFFIASLILFGCESKKTELVSTSPDGTIKITIQGNKSFMEPWNMSILIEGLGKKKEIKDVQMYADELSNKNIMFNWENNESCIITLIEQDDTQRTLQIDI